MEGIMISNKTKIKLNKLTEKILNLIKQRKRYMLLCNKDKRIYRYSIRSVNRLAYQLKKLKIYLKKKSNQDKSFRKKKNKLKKNQLSLLKRVSKNNQLTISLIIDINI